MALGLHQASQQLSNILLSRSRRAIKVGRLNQNAEVVKKGTILGAADGLTMPIASGDHFRRRITTTYT
jgi:hypothetical protein